HNIFVRYNEIINTLNKNTLNQCIIFPRFIVFKLF
ncbi:hypothetical protein, partial [Plasmodium yoelii yoelii]